MSPKIQKGIRIGYGILLTVLILVAGGALILACLTIFFSPEGTFSPETVSTAFGRIALLVYLAIGGIIGGAVLSVIWPDEKAKIKPIREDKTAVRKMMADYKYGKSGMAPIVRERIFRIVWTSIAAGVSVLAAVPSIVWVCTPGHFGTWADKNQEVMVASAIVLGGFIVAMVTSFVMGILTAASYRRERMIRKLAISSQNATRRDVPIVRPLSFWERPFTIWAVRGTVLIVAVVFIVLGVSNGGMHDVFGKAVRICTECIGLG